jgi:2-polyprenyl-3-methyl-5-hydroxy-6-metoxy-1,4-benzoquinol methylase
MKSDIALKILAKNKELYNAIAADFSTSRYKLWPEFEYFKGYLAKGQAVLDIGCGNGRLLAMLKEFEPNYLGIDNSSGLIKEAKKKWPNQDFKIVDILDLSSIKIKYDIVILVATLHHIPSAKLRLQALENVYKVLKPGGKLLMTNWNLLQKRYIKYIIKYNLLKIAEPNKEVIEGVRAKNLDLQDVFIPWQKNYLRYIYAFNELTTSRLVKKAGFEIIKNVANTRNVITIAKKK